MQERYYNSLKSTWGSNKNLKKNRKGSGGVVKIWSIKEKISGMTFVNPNTPAVLEV